jgi:gamma-glutamyl-gamma-aminobutyrate hydrolase PuuD
MARPLIGISIQQHPGTPAVKRGRPILLLDSMYAERIRRAGGIPVLLAPGGGDEGEILDRLDGMLFSGGEDVDPVHFDQPRHPTVTDIDAARDAQEIPLAVKVREQGIPVLGICRGMQLLNIAWGGDLIQDLPSHLPDGLKHQQQSPVHVATHSVTLERASTLAGLARADDLLANSFHHQAVDRLAGGLRAVGWTMDGTIEAFEATDWPCLGVQWHPELLEDVTSDALFDWLVTHARRRARQPRG